MTTRTFAELRQDVAKFGAAMRNSGIKTGDRVVGGFVKYRFKVHFGAARQAVTKVTGKNVTVCPRYNVLRCTAYLVITRSIVAPKILCK